MMPMTMMMIMTMTDDDHDDDNEVDDDAALLLVIRAWRTATIDGGYKLDASSICFFLK